MSERRVERLVNPGKNNDDIFESCQFVHLLSDTISSPTFLSFNFLAYSELPAFLVQEGGLNSGFMLAHCTAAALGMIHIHKF